ncbi:MAG: pilus assembly protein [Chloroflexi bacterium]|jgi:pilus assembly protein Flp/PilA|nr:pilus assembly protein [Chloroflexota bacterium]MBT3670731.1 pilus assembly protein [Chloroflexota bacterium]MBT4533379.1 pilus assembly protein [Chloroflexota bacterium]MBT4682865.1 pilus assembly protein [Chloroflexota bacterium]MBT4756343.1 pilus assembly protein [Chloroflexota bacterium]
MKYFSNEKAQGLLEYALILMLVVMVVMIMLIILGPAVGNMYSNIIVNF